MPSDSDTDSLPLSAEERDKLIEKALGASTFLSEVEVTEADKLVTFSTCVYDYDNARYVLVGVLSPIGQADDAAAEGADENP